MNQVEEEEVNQNTERLLSNVVEDDENLNDERSTDLDKPTSFREESKQILFLAAGIFIARSSWVMIKTTDSALLGHVSAEALDASSLSDLFTQSTGVALFGGVLGIFVGQAVGAGNKELAAIWLQVSIVVILGITIPIMITWWLTGPVLKLFHASPALVDDAAYFARALSFCLPARSLFGQITQYLGGHGIVKPEAQVSMFGAVFNLSLGLFFVLGIPVKGWEGLGFEACPWVTVSTEYAQLILMWVVFIYFQQLHLQVGWTGWNWENITKKRVKEYLSLYVPSAGSMCSDFWRMAAVGAIAATLGDDDLGVFTASYRILWMALTIVGSCAYSVRVRLAMYIGAGNKENAEKAVAVGTTITLIFLGVSAILVFSFINPLSHVFSNDPNVRDLFAESQIPFTLTLVLMNLAVFLEQIPVAMGKTKIVFYVGIIGSWVGQVPCAYLSTTYWRKDIVGLYYGVAAGYALLCSLLALVIVTTDYQHVIDEAARRNEAEPAPSTESATEA